MLKPRVGTGAKVRTVQRIVNASPAEIFDLLARPNRHADFDGSGTVRSAVSGPERLSLDARFGVAMERGVRYRSSNVVVEFDEPTRIAWQSGAFAKGGRLIGGGQIWRYELEPTDDGHTLVKESYDLSRARPAGLIDRLAGVATEANMVATLDRLAVLFA